MKTLILALLITFSVQSQDEHIGWLWVNENNIPLDTQAHIVGGFAMSAPASLYWREKTNSGFWGVVGGTATMFAFGCIKETLDQNKGGKWSWNDIGYGTGAALIGGITFNLWAGNVAKKKEIERLKGMMANDSKTKY